MLLQEKLIKFNLILGSASPQRSLLLKQLDLDFSVHSIPVKEDYNLRLKNSAITEYLAELKSDAFGSLKENELLITADTLVFLDEIPIGKPENKDHAKNILMNLQGNVHQVITGVCVRSAYKKSIFSVCTDVFIKSLSSREIIYYVEKYNPIDKSGGYGLQQWFGAAAVDRLEGCYYNVIGLPLSALYHKLLIF